MQKQFLTFAFGGTTKWTGRSMRAAHKNMGLGDDHFNAVAEDLGATLVELGLTQDLISEVMGVVGSVKDDVLNR